MACEVFCTRPRFRRDARDSTARYYSNDDLEFSCNITEVYEVDMSRHLGFIFVIIETYDSQLSQDI